MILAGSFAGAVEVAEQNCSEWLLAGNGEVFHAEELHEVAEEFDAKTPLGEDEFLVVTDDGSIGLLFPNLKEPEMYFVSPEWAVVNILNDDPRKYMIPDDGAQTMGGAGVAGAAGNTTGNAMNEAVAENAAETGMVFCKNCGAKIKADSKFCQHCGAKNAPEFCSNCGAKLKPGSVFCENCGTRV
jgi:hypothetical protein